jgi:hypothetical protein
VFYCLSRLTPQAGELVVRGRPAPHELCVPHAAPLPIQLYIHHIIASQLGAGRQYPRAVLRNEDGVAVLGGKHAAGVEPYAKRGNVGPQCLYGRRDTCAGRCRVAQVGRLFKLTGRLSALRLAGAM